VIEREGAFKFYLINDKPRQLTEGTSNSYIDYLNNVINHTGLDITSKSITDKGSIREIINHLSDTAMPDGSRRNCQSALNAYLGFLSHSGSEAVEIYPDEMPSYIEGAVSQIIVNKYERDSSARKACIKHHNSACKVCDLEFYKVYGEIGINFIHVHHITPISELKEQYVIDPVNDLIPVCPNCNAMLHKRNPPYTVKELQEIML